MYKAKNNAKKEDGYYVEIPFCGSASILIKESEINEKDSKDKEEALVNAAIGILAEYSLEELGKDDRSEIVEWDWLKSVTTGNWFHGPRNDWDYQEEEEIPEYEKVEFERFKLEKISMSVVNMSKLAKALILIDCKLKESSYWKEGKKAYADLAILIQKKDVEEFEKLTGFTLIT